MRKIGNILLWVGFCWIALLAFESATIPRSAGMRHLQSLGQQEEFSRKDVIKAFAEGQKQVAVYTQVIGIGASIGAALMLVGAILLNKAAKRDLTVKEPPVSSVLTAK